MDYRRLILYFALAFIAFSLWSNWLKDYPTVTTAPSTTDANVTTLPSAATASVAISTTTVPPPSVTEAVTTQKSARVPEARMITVNTDLFQIKIDTLGGNIISLGLLKYPAAVKSKQPSTLLTDEPTHYYVTQTGLTGPEGPDTSKGPVQYQTTQSTYTMADHQNTLKVDLTWRDPDGLLITKTFQFQRDDYAIPVLYTIDNRSARDWSGSVYAQIQQKPQPKQGWLQISTYTGGAISSPEKPYQKISYRAMEKENVNTNIHGGWLAIQQRYFLSAWVPNQQQNNHYYSGVDANKIYTLGYLGPTLNVPAGQKFSTTTTLYAGPELEDRLKAIAPHLDLTIDFGWLWWLSIPILWVMQQIHKVVGNWGWAIILVTLFIKLLFYKFSEMSYRSMARMRQLQPKLIQLKERYGNDRAKMSQATMELYRKEKVNPLGGCLPILVQIPVFIALYYVLIESVQLRQAPFMFWIHDLSAKDPYFILPILMGISMWIQQKLNPQPPDPMQAKVMQLMPIMFTLFFFTFPSGLVLYWLTNNVLSILQQWHITRNLEKKVLYKIEEKLDKK